MRKGDCMARIKKLDARSIIAARANAKKRLSKAANQNDITFTKCYEKYFGVLYNWEQAIEIGEHPGRSDNLEIRALYAGFRFGKGESKIAELKDEYDRIMKEFNEKIAEFTKKVNEALAEE